MVRDAEVQKVLETISSLIGKNKGWTSEKALTRLHQESDLPIQTVRQALYELERAGTITRRLHGDGKKVTLGICSK